MGESKFAYCDVRSVGVDGGGLDRREIGGLSTVVGRSTASNSRSYAFGVQCSRRGEGPARF